MQMAPPEREQKAIGLESQPQAGSRRKLKHKAGIALLREARTGKEVLLVQQVNGHWSLPKGKRKQREPIRETGLRECREETGYEPQALDFVGWGVNSHKHVRFYLWKSEIHRLVCSKPAGSRRNEILQMAWVALKRARHMIKPWQADLLAKIAS